MEINFSHADLLVMYGYAHIMKEYRPWIYLEMFVYSVYTVYVCTVNVSVYWSVF